MRKKSPVIALAISKSLQKRLFAGGAPAVLKRFAGKVRAHNKDTRPDMKDLKRLLADADGVMTGWGSPKMTAEVLALGPNVRIIAHSAGSVKGIVSDEVWKRKIRVTSCAAAIAPFVAEYTLGCMIMGIKRIFPIRDVVREKKDFHVPQRATSREMHGATIGVIAASHVGRHVLRLLESFQCNVLLYDPHVSAARAKRLGAKKVTLTQLLKKSDIVSLHAPATAETKNMLGAKQFRMMKDGAVFINTARGMLVDEKALVAELRRKRLFAFIDVTEPEPPRRSHPFYKLDNVVLTPHLAGCVTTYSPLGDLAVEELRRFFTGGKPLNPVTQAMLSRTG